MQQLAFSIEEVQAATGLGRTHIYKLISSNVLPARKIGRLTRVLKADLEAFLAGLKAYPVQSDKKVLE